MCGQGSPCGTEQEQETGGHKEGANISDEARKNERRHLHLRIFCGIGLNVRDSALLEHEAAGRGRCGWLVGRWRAALYLS